MSFRAVTSEKIIIYGSPTCPLVPSVRATLERADVDYEYVDIARDFHARERVREINQGYESVPTFVFPDGSSLTEPSIAELEAKLEPLGYQRPVPRWLEGIRRFFEHPLTRVLAIILLMGGMLSDTESLLIIGALVLALGLLLGRLIDR